MSIQRFESKTHPREYTAKEPINFDRTNNL